jgi:phosphoribosylglycinamide formyltransferase-1
MKDRLRIAMLISGGGTTMREIIRACKNGRLSRIDPALVIASRPDAGGIAKAREEGVRTDDVLVIQRRDFADETAFGEAILAACRTRGIQFVGQYGWLPKTPKNVIEAFPGMMVNQHPGPLDPGKLDFGGQGMYGRRVHCARLYFVRYLKIDPWTEVVAQRVAPEFDQGTVIRRRRVEILTTDDVQALQERALPLEHETQIEALEDFMRGSVTDLRRDEPLVWPQHANILTEAKNVARLLYPVG